MAKEKKAKKQDEIIEKQFTVGLQPVFRRPRPRRANKAISLLKRFAFKHFRVSGENVLISNKLNEFIWKGGRENLPRKVQIKAVVSKGKASLFLKGEKIKKEEKKKEEKAEKKEEKTAEEKAAEEERERKKEEKKIAEKAAEKAAIKRGKE